MLHKPAFTLRKSAIIFVIVVILYTGFNIASSRALREKECGAACYDHAVSIAYFGSEAEKIEVTEILKRNVGIFKLRDLPRLAAIRDAMWERNKMEESRDQVIKEYKNRMDDTKPLKTK